jgi:hypothetical protein
MLSGIFDLSLLDMEHLFDSFDDLTMSKSLASDYTNQLSLNYLPSQTRRLSAGKIRRIHLKTKQ